MRETACQLCDIPFTQGTARTVRMEWLNEQGVDLADKKGLPTQPWKHIVICKTCEMAYHTEKM